MDYWQRVGYQEVAAKVAKVSVRDEDQYIQRSIRVRNERLGEMNGQRPPASVDSAREQQPSSAIMGFQDGDERTLRGEGGGGKGRRRRRGGEEDEVVMDGFGGGRPVRV